MRMLLASMAAIVLATGHARAADMPVSTVNIASLKSVFDAHGIPAEISTNQNGASYISATVGGRWMMTAPVDCKDDNQNGTCNSVLIQSTAYTLKTPPTLEQLMEFTRTGPKFVTVLQFGAEGHMLVRQLFDVSAGVGADYIKSRFKEFLLEDAVFENYISSLAAPGAASAGFSASTGNPLAGQVAGEMLVLEPKTAAADITFGK